MTAPGNFKERLRALAPAVLTGLERGSEKESLGGRPDGALALTPHPKALGSSIKHPHIPTDFSESLLELITGVHTSVDACVEELKRIHGFVYRNIGDEVLWGASMPCSLPDENAIPIARYGDSNVGRAKTVYRIGLSHRYGRRMQMIAGLHYNFSLPGSAWPLPGLRGPNEGYFALIRNFRRHAVAGARALGAHGARGVSQRRPGQAPRELQQPGELRRLSRRRAHPTLPALPGDRHPRRPRRRRGRGQLQAARHEPPADRERVLQHHPPPARHPPGRAAAARAARARRTVRRSARDGPRPLLADRHHRGHGALSRRVPAALPLDREPAGHAAGDRSHRAQQAARLNARARAGAAP